jgi:hypothetical protein
MSRYYDHTGDLMRHIWSTFRRITGAPFLAGATIALAVAATPAAAHYVYSKARVHEASSLCVEVRSEVSHGTEGGGFYKTDVWLSEQALGIACLNQKMGDPGTILSKQNHWAWVGNDVFLCTLTGDFTNTSRTNHIS